MGDGFEYRLTSWNQLPFNHPEGADLPVGTRLSPSLKFEWKGIFSELRFEGGAAQAAATPLGANYFESTPSSTLTNKTFGCYVYEPKDAKDTFRANACVRGAELGYHFNSDWLIRAGRRRYEVTEYENMTMANAYSAVPHWANVYIPYGWLGAEVRYDRVRENETFRRVMFNTAIMNGAESGYLGLLQGFTSFALDEGKSAPQLSLTAYGILRGNPPPSPPNPDIAENGTAHGEGFATQYSQGIFSGGLGFNHQTSSFKNKNGLNGSQDRDEFTTFLDVHPSIPGGVLRFRGAFSWLTRKDEGAKNPYDPPAGHSEYHTEWTVSYHPVDGVQLSLGYLGGFGETFSTHMAFLGLLTTYKGLIPFGSSEDKK